MVIKIQIEKQNFVYTLLLNSEQWIYIRQKEKPKLKSTFATRKAGALTASKSDEIVFSLEQQT